MDDPWTDGRVYYLLLLGVFVLVWVFRGYRHRLGTAVQHAAIWVLIFIGVILAIGFKDDLTRILSGGPEQIDGQTIALKRQGDGHFHATLEVNGHPVRFIIDTGATMLVLSRRDARAAGLDPDNLSFNLRTRTANGEVMSAPVRLDSVTLGEFTDRDVRATVNGGDLDISLLGMSYLDRYRGFRVEGDRMYLIR